MSRAPASLPIRAGMGSGIGRRGQYGTSVVQLGRWAFYHLASFELVFTLFFYSNVVKLLIPKLPVDETVLFAGLSAAIGFYVILRQGIYLRALPIITAALLLIGWAAMSMGWTPSRILAPRTLSYLFTFNLWCVVAGGLIIAPSRERTIRFLTFVLLLSLLVAVYGLFIYFVFGSFRFYSGFAGFGRMYLNWGYAAANGAIIAFPMVIFSRTMSHRQLVAAGAFAICAAFLLVGSGRGPLLSLLFACCIAIAAGLPQITRGRIDVPRWQVIALFCLIAAGGYVAHLAMSGTSIATFHRFEKLFDQVDNSEIIRGPNRFSYYAAAVRFWLDAPIVGHGIASFSNLFAGLEREGTQPHNIFLEMLSDLGLIGLGLLLLFFWSGLRLVTREQLRHDPLLLCVLMLLAGRFVAAMVSADISGQQALFLWLGLMAVRPKPLGQLSPYRGAAPDLPAGRAAPHPPGFRSSLR
jgi:O-antigen ligase